MKSVTLFNNKGGVGKTTLTFNIAHMFAEEGYQTLVLDYDPQCNISSLFLDEDDLIEAWEADKKASSTSASPARTVAGAIDLIRRGKGGLKEPELVSITPNLWLLPGHLSLSRFEQTLAEEWPKCGDSDNERALDVTTALDLLSDRSAEKVNADIVLIDVGPSLGALSRAALLACDAIVVPLAPDLFSLQGLENVGPTLRDWRKDWTAKHSNSRDDGALGGLSQHSFQPIGYIVQQHLQRGDQLPQGYQRWAAQIPDLFRARVLGERNPPENLTIETDPYCIAQIKHFASLVPIAQYARKPLFQLKHADGIGGSQLRTVSEARGVFRALVLDLCRRLDKLDTKPAKRKPLFRKPISR